MNTTEIEAFLAAEIELGSFSGAAFSIRNGSSEFHGYLGRISYCPDDPPVTSQTLWDLASLSKVVATTTLAMQFVDQVLLDLEAPVASVLPEFGQNGKQDITFHDLMTHESGLVAFRPYHKMYRHRDQVLRAIYAESLIYPTGSKMVYSDLSMIVVAEALSRIGKASLGQLVTKFIAEPNRLVSLQYSPALAGHREQCALTESIEPWRTDYRRAALGDLGAMRVYGDSPSYVQGEVHDPTATVLGGVAGHAGLFGSLPDLDRFMQALSRDTLCRAETRLRFTTRASERSSRALGWDTKSAEGSSAGHKFGPQSFGHTGYTGTSIWRDPEADLTAILLTNRVHPTSENVRIMQVRPRFHDLVWDAFSG